MAKKKEIKEYKIQGKKLVCPVCQSTKFWTRETLMNTSGMTFFGVEWANRKATNFVCDKCGYVYWFLI